MLRFLTSLLGIRVLRRSELAPFELATPRLRLRSFRTFEDWPRFREYHRDPEVVRYLGPRPASDEDLRAWLVAYSSLTSLSARHLHLGIQLADRSRLLGECALTSDRGRSGRAFLGFVLHRDAWGQGIATEAAHALVAHAFRELRYREVWAGCTRDNVRSRRILEKIGLAPTDEAVDFPGAPPGVQSLAFRTDAATWLRWAEEGQADASRSAAPCK